MIKNSMIKIVLITSATKNRSFYMSLARILITISMLERTGSLNIVFDSTINNDIAFNM